MTSGEPALGRPRVFVAVWPDAIARTRLHAIANDLAQSAPRARRVAPSNFHLTLAFVGLLEPERVAELVARIDDYAMKEFDWVIDRIGHFDRARVVWAGGPRNPALFALAADMRRLLDSMAIGYDRKAFAAHVTMLRNVGQWPPEPASPQAPITPIQWRCRAPTLVRSERGADGPRYVAIAR